MGHPISYEFNVMSSKHMTWRHMKAYKYLDICTNISPCSDTWSLNKITHMLYFLVSVQYIHVKSHKKQLTYPSFLAPEYLVAWIYLRNIPASSQGCCLNPKAWCFWHPKHYPFSNQTGRSRYRNQRPKSMSWGSGEVDPRDHHHHLQMY